MTSKTNKTPGLFVFATAFITAGAAGFAAYKLLKGGKTTPFKTIIPPASLVKVA